MQIQIWVWSQLDNVPFKFNLMSRWAVVDLSMEGKAINLIWYPFWQSGLLSHSIDAKSSNDGFADDDNDDNAEESHQEISQYFWLRLICQFYDNSLLDSRLLFLITQPPIMRHVIVQCQRDHCHLHHVPRSHCYKKQHNSFSYPSPLYKSPLDHHLHRHWLLAV